MSEFVSPGQIEEVIESITRHGIWWILLFVFISMFIENVFPPYPGDAVIFAAGFISGSGELSVAPLIVISIIGSLASIMVVHGVGMKYGRVMFEKRWLRFLKPEKLPSIEAWFGRYGSGVLLASRFLAGTRSLVALTAGIGGVKPARMALLSGISVLIWNCLIILSAHYLHSNWEMVYSILNTYNRVILIVITSVIVVYVIVRIARRKKTI